MRLDGGGNLIARDGKAYAPWSIKIGRCWLSNRFVVGVYYGLSQDVPPEGCVTNNRFTGFRVMRLASLRATVREYWDAIRNRSK